MIRRAVVDAGGADPAPLDGYLETLAAASAAGRRLSRREIASCRHAGMTAAERGVPLRVVVDLYLSATWLAWRHLRRPPGLNPDDAATVVLRAANDAIAALAEGSESAQRLAIRHEESTRREFIDDLLHGSGDVTRLPERAARYGLHLVGGFVVAVATATTTFFDGDERIRRLEAAVTARFAGRGSLITTKDGALVCVAPQAHRDIAVAFADLSRSLPASVECRVGIGRPHPGPGGVAHSYQEARDALALAGRLGLPGPVLHARDLLVYQVLTRDRAAMADLVGTVLSPLQRARGGARPLLDTLSAYFDTGNAAAAGRRLRIGTRTVTYRLHRIDQLTGYNPTDPAQRYTLKTAALGALLLGWPDQMLDADR